LTLEFKWHLHLNLAYRYLPPSILQCNVSLPRYVNLPLMYYAPLPKAKGLPERRRT